MAEGHESEGLRPALSPKANALSKWLLWRNRGNDSQGPLSTPLPRPWDHRPRDRGTLGRKPLIPSSWDITGGETAPRETTRPLSPPLLRVHVQRLLLEAKPLAGGHLPPKRKRVPVSRRRREARRRKLRNPVIPPNTIRIRLSGSRITKVPCMAEKREDLRLLTSFSQSTNISRSSAMGPRPNAGSGISTAIATTTTSNDSNDDTKNTY